MRLSSFSQHAVGLAGQVTAALPQLLVGIYVARVDGIVMAGHFAVLTGVAATTFAASMWGFRSYVVLDRLTRFGAASYAAGRLVAVTVAAVVTLAIASCAESPPLLAVAVILLRSSDTFIDLAFAINQVVYGTVKSIHWYSRQQFLRLVTIASLVALSTALLRGLPSGAALVVGASGSALLGSIALYQSVQRRWSPPKDLLALFRATTLFAIASIVCAAVTSAPRMALPRFHTGLEFGAVGAALTTSTLFGMVFFTTWTRHLPRLMDRNGRLTRIRFALETAALLAMLCILSFTILPALVALIFGFDLGATGDAIRGTLATTAVFYAGMTLANLYKVTAWQIMEVVTYAVALAVFVLPIVLFPATTSSLPVLIAIAGLAMAALSMPAVLGFDPGRGGAARQ